MEYVQVRQHTLHFMVKRYRAEVVTINQDGTVRVKYVDYGNSEEEHVTNLRKLKPNLRQTPIQVISTTSSNFNTAIKTKHKSMIYMCSYLTAACSYNYCLAADK